MSLKDLGALLLLSALWGGSFLFMRVAAPVFGPVLLIEFRVGLAALALLGYAFALRDVPALRTHWRQFLVVGAINSALPFVLIATAELRLPASLAATLNATTPLFGALVAAAWLRERLTWLKVCGLLLGFVGVAVTVGLGPIPLSPATLLATGLSLTAAISYGIAAVYTKAKVHGAAPRAVATYSQMFAAILLLPAVPFALPHAAPTAVATGSVLALALLCTAFAYLLYFYLIFKIGPTRATMVTYLSPVFGTLWGFLFLHETLGLGSLGGFGLILIGVGLVSGAIKGGARLRERVSG